MDRRVSLRKEDIMKKYRIREGSPVWWLRLILGIAAFIIFMSLPSTIEAWL